MKKKSSEELDLNSLEKSQAEHLDSFQPTLVICITCEQKIALLPDSLEHRTIKCTNCSSVLKVSCLQRISLSTHQNEHIETKTSDPCSLDNKESVSVNLAEPMAEPMADIESMNKISLLKELGTQKKRIATSLKRKASDISVPDKADLKYNFHKRKSTEHTRLKKNNALMCSSSTNLVHVLFLNSILVR